MEIVVQGWANNPHRSQDLEDIRALLRANRSTLNMAEVREYFRLFRREALLEETLSEARVIRVRGRRFEWGRGSLAAASELGARYIAALQAADAGDCRPLLEFLEQTA